MTRVPIPPKFTTVFILNIVFDLNGNEKKEWPSMAQFLKSKKIVAAVVIWLISSMPFVQLVDLQNCILIRSFTHTGRLKFCIRNYGYSDERFSYPHVFCTLG